MFHPHRIWIGAIGVTLLTVCPSATLAQITGDGTLGTQVNGSPTAPCTGTCTITDGTIRGNNLFHSLRQFSLPNGDFAGLITNPSIQNVIVRVTGVGSPFISTINGTIATSTPTNFFLLNPNGILLGPNATLNIGGSFLATPPTECDLPTAQSSANDPAPLLTISVPIGLQVGSNQAVFKSGDRGFSQG